MHGFDESLLPSQYHVRSMSPLWMRVEMVDALTSDTPSTFYVRFWNHQFQRSEKNLEGDTSRVVMDEFFLY